MIGHELGSSCLSVFDDSLQQSPYSSACNAFLRNHPLHGVICGKPLNVFVVATLLGAAHIPMGHILGAF